MPSPRGRLRYVGRLRRSRWRQRQLSTNIPPFNEGCPPGGPLPVISECSRPYLKSGLPASSEYAYF